jgi:hypothetical protein
VKKWISSPLFRKLFVWFGVAIILFAIIGFLFLPPILKYILVSNLQDVLHREVSVEKISLTLSHSACLTKGRFSASGRIAHDPLKGNLKMHARDIEIPPLQPYFTDSIKIIVVGGAIGAEGEQEGSEMGLNYKGSSGISRINSADKMNAEDFLKWTSLNIVGIHAGYQQRVFLLEPKSLEPEKKESLKDSRVYFALK